jgi:hypothetical protein
MAIGANSAAIARTCDAPVAKLATIDDVHFERTSPSGLNRFLASSQMSELSLDCGVPGPTLFAALLPSSVLFLPRSFSNSRQDLAQLSWGSENDVEDAMRKCQRSALQDPGELSEASRSGFKVECQAYARNGGGATFTIYASVSRP